MTNKKVSVMYLLSEEGRKKSLLSGGDGKRIQCIEAEISKDVLDLATVDNNGVAYLTIGFKKYSYNEYCNERELSNNYNTVAVDVCIEKRYDGKPCLCKKKEFIEFDEPKSVEELIEFEKKRTKKYSEKLNKAELECEKAVKEFEEKRAEKIAEEEREKKKQEAEKAAIKKEEQRLKEETEKADREWIEKYGSDYLKNATKLGYKCEREYIKERCEKEFSGFKIDFYKDYIYEERVNPSKKALKEVMKLISEGVDAKIVWLISSEKEAIKIEVRGFDLIKEIPRT